MAGVRTPACVILLLLAICVVNGDDWSLASGTGQVIRSVREYLKNFVFDEEANEVHSRKRRAVNCPQGDAIHNDKCYRIVKSAFLSFADAKAFCENTEGDYSLVSLLDQTEADFLRALLTADDTGDAWIGAERADHNSAWTWTNGDAFPTGVNWLWKIGHPLIPSVVDTNCGLLKKKNGYFMTENDCAATFHFVCKGELPLNDRSPPSPGISGFGDCVCNAWGDPHYTTLDGHAFDFQGICTYTMVVDTSSPIPIFEIEASNRAPYPGIDVSIVDNITIYIDNYDIQLLPDQNATVNGIFVALPYNVVPEFSISISGKFVIIIYPGKFWVSFAADAGGDTSSSLFGIHDDFKGNTTGLCGSCDDNVSNDLQFPNGTQASSELDFGNSWKTEESIIAECPDSTTTITCPPEDEATYSSIDYCGAITDPAGFFVPCHGVVDPQVYFDACVFDVCIVGEHLLCPDIAVYYDACLYANVDFQAMTFRTPTFCPLSCPPNQHYNPCMSPCPATCITPEGCLNDPCVEGCECDVGFYLSNADCVPEEECGCIFNGQFYPHGSSWVMPGCGQQCTCVGFNDVQCVSYNCDGAHEVCEVQNGILDCYCEPLYVRDVNGDCVDDEAPVIDCTAPETAFDCDNDGSEAVFFTVTATDNIDPSVSIVCTISSGSTFTVIGSPHSVTCTATDDAGNTDTCTFDVIVQADTAIPVFDSGSLQDETIDGGLCGPAVYSYTPPTVTDDCNDVSFTCDIDSGTELDCGPHTITCTATDGSGNEGTISATITVTCSDVDAPTILTPGDFHTIICNAGDPVIYSVTASDNCDGGNGTPVTCVPASGDPFQCGENTVTCTATDHIGNEATSIFVVTAMCDDLPPIVVPPEDINNITLCSSEGGPVNYTLVITDDSDYTIDCNIPSGSNFACGSSAITCDVIDECQNSETVNFNVDVTCDSSSPAFPKMLDINVPSCDSEGIAVNFEVPEAVDAHDGVVPVSCTHNSGDVFHCGSTRVTCSATDSCGHTRTRRFWIRVGCTPIVRSRDETVFACDTDNGTIWDYAGVTAVDEAFDPLGFTCTATSIEYGNPDFFPCGRSNYRCTTDPSPYCNKTATRTRSVTVKCDNDPPTLIVNDINIASCDSQPTAVTFTPHANDTLDTDVSVLCTHNPGDLYPCGSTSVLCTATDECAHEATDSFTITVTCNVDAPVINVPENLEIESCEVGGSNVDFEVTVSHSVEQDIVPTCTKNSGDHFNCGVTTVECNAVDECGHQTDVTFDVTVVCDTFAPVWLKCNPHIFGHDLDGNGVEAITFTHDVEDNCGPVVIDCTADSGDEFICGEHMHSCTATDLSGNSATCYFKVTLVCDLDFPRITCNDVDVVDCEGDGESISFDVTAVDSTGASLSYTCDEVEPVTLTIPPPPQLVTCTTVDSELRMAQCFFFIDVIPDIIQPQFTSSFSIPPGSSDTCFGATIDYSLPVAEDECGTPTVTCIPGPGVDAPCFSSLVECTATDLSGNTVDISTTVNVACSVPGPEMTCSDSIIVIDEDEDGVEEVVFNPPTATATCGTPVVTCDAAVQQTYACGLTTVTCTAVDDIGLTATCSFNVIVGCGDGPPIMSCPDVGPVSDCLLDGQAVTYDGIVATSSDGTEATVTCDPPSGEILDIGSHSVTCTGEDVLGRTSNCSFTVTVTEDNEPPFFINALNATDGFSNDCTGDEINYHEPSVSDNCGVETLVCTPPPGTLFECGETTVECIITDIHGNTASASVVNTVVCPDIVPPTINCDDIVYAHDDNDDKLESVSYFVNASDPCGETSIQCDYQNPDEFPCGLTDVSCIATDEAGNTASCNIVVNVTCDVIPPTLNCQDNINEIDCENDGGDNVNYGVTAHDDDGQQLNVTCNPPEGSFFPTNVIEEVICTATDAAGNTGTCRFDVHVVEDVFPPILDVNDVTIDTAECNGDIGNYDQPPVTEHCSATVECTPSSGSFFECGEHTITCTAVDQNGNADTETFTLTMNCLDANPPVISGGDDTTVDVCSKDGGDVTVDMSATDECIENPNITCDPIPDGFFACGVNEISCETSDQAGNVGIADFLITVNCDDSAPTFNSVSDVYMQTDTCGVFNVDYTMPTANDPCGIDSVICSHPPGSDFECGVTEVTCIATDSLGNSATVSFNVEVDCGNVLFPVVTGPSNQEYVTCSNGMPLDFVVTAEDDCDGELTPSCSKSSGDHFDCGATLVTCTAVNSAGNEGSASFTFTVICDEQSPVINELECSNDITAPVECGDAGQTVDFQIPSATDNCGVTVTCDYQPGDFFECGDTLVTCTATDEIGLTSSCGFTISVTCDEYPPSITCPDNMVLTDCENDGEEGCWRAVAVSDDCGVARVESSPDMSAVLPTGTTVVTMTVYDFAGNSAQCTFTVEVVPDNGPSMINCVSDITMFDCEGDGKSISWTEPTAMSACGSLDVTCDHPNPVHVNCNQPLTVTCSATDPSGATIHDSFTINVLCDENRPIIGECPADEAFLATNSWGAHVTYQQPQATDECNVTVTCDHPSGNFGCGVTTVTCTAEDQAGNIDTCSFDITIVCGCPPNSNFNPCMSPCPPTCGDQLYCPDEPCVPGCECSAGYIMDGDECVNTCPCIVNGEEYMPGDIWINDDCSIVCSCYNNGTAECLPYECGDNAYCGEINDEPVCICLYGGEMDENGDCPPPTPCDETPPMLQCSGDVIVLDADCSTQEIVAYSDPVVSDNSGIVSVVCDPPSSSIFSVGTTTVQCVATDGSDNVATCEFTVTVVKCDMTPPEIQCPHDITTLDFDDSGDEIVSYSGLYVSDDRDDAVSVSCTHASGGVYPVGTTVVTCTATDEAGNTDTCTFEIVVEPCDHEPPTVECPNDINIMGEDCSTAVHVHYLTPNGQDNSGFVTVTCTPEPGYFYPETTTTVTCTAVDPAGNTDSCSFNITVECDVTPPEISCPVDQTARDADCSGDEPVSYPTPEASDNSGDVTVTCSPPSGAVFPVGTTQVECIAVDPSGNIDECSFEVTTLPCAVGPFKLPCTRNTETRSCVVGPFQLPCTRNEISVRCAAGPFQAPCTRNQISVLCAAGPFQAPCTRRPCEPCAPEPEAIPNM